MFVRLKSDLYQQNWEENQRGIFWKHFVKTLNKNGWLLTCKRNSVKLGLRFDIVQSVVHLNILPTDFFKQFTDLLQKFENSFVCLFGWLIGCF